MKISVLGCGYLGAVHAAAMASLGHRVVGIDVDAAKVAMLSEGRAPFFEPGLEEMLAANIAGGRLRFATDAAEAEGSTVHFVTVGTPAGEGGALDVSAVEQAVDGLLPYLAAGNLVVGKSTVPPGTAERLAARVADRGASLAWNPEFLREGLAVRDSLSPDRIVFGVRPGDTAAADVLERVYAGIDDGIPRFTTDYATAQLVKISANAFLATKVSFINAMADVAEATGADVVQLAILLGQDERIGPRFLRAGLGFGGGCLPKDLRGFLAAADDWGVGTSLGFLREVEAINLGRGDRVVELAVEAAGGDVTGTVVGVLGLAFKPDSDDVRESPALRVAERLAALGAHVKATDPHAVSTARAQVPGLEYVDTAADAMAGSDIVLVLTDWAEYSAIEPEEVTPAWSRAIIDARNCLEPARWRAAGWRYRALGRPDDAG